MNIRYKRPDTKNSLSIIDAAKSDLDFTLTLIPSDVSGPTIIRNIYESFRMLGDALMIAKGAVSIDHTAPINELLKLSVKTERPLNLIDSLRRLRHNINYYGYHPNLIEVKDFVSFAKGCFPILYDAVKKECVR
jgi:hypothetical protein